MTVSLADVSTRLQFGSEQEAEKYIRDMVSPSVTRTMTGTLHNILAWYPLKANCVCVREGGGGLNLWL